ncbi:MAG: branched-chain amino acid ABC transporter permease [Hyphomicrobiaceae bacterium]|nr:branched-chain amino acid ABC transporter permease [Hyphomicrobiaceae bacterium]
MGRSSLARDVLLAIVVFAVLAALPYFIPGKGFTDFVVRLAAFAIFATSLNLLVGYGGMESFGHGLYFGLGCYSFVLIMKNFDASIPVAFLLTVLLSVVVGAVVGSICVNLNETYFAFLTLAFQMLLHSLIIAWTPITGGDQGLTGIPKPPFLGMRLDDYYHLYLFASGLMVASLLVMYHLVQSPFGYTLRMIRDNAARAPFLGISVFRVRLMAYVIAGAFGSIGGIVMSLFATGAFPDFAYWTISGEAIFMIMLGGITVFLGPLVGTIMLLLLNDVVTKLTSHYGLVLGTIILLFALGLRKGLMDFLADMWRDRKRSTPAPLPTGAPAVSAKAGE